MLYKNHSWVHDKGDVDSHVEGVENEKRANEQQPKQQPKNPAAGGANDSEETELWLAVIKSSPTSSSQLIGPWGKGGKGKGSS